MLREVYVSPNGDDANPGSKERPVQSLHKALTLVDTSGTITLAGGTYREKADLLLRRGGTAEAPMVIQGAAGETAVIKGSEPVTGWQAADNGAWKRENWPVNSQQFFVDGKPLQQIGVRSPLQTKEVGLPKPCLPPVGEGLADLKPGCFWYDDAAKTLYAMLTDGSDPNAHLLEASVADRLLCGWGTSYVTIRNLTFMHTNQTAKGWTNGTINLGASHWIIEDCHIEYGDFAGVAGGGNAHIIRRCVIANNGDSGISLNGSDEAHGWKFRPDREPMDILFEDLTIANNNYRHFNDSWHAGGIKCIPCCRGVTVRRCTVTDNYGAGIWFDSCLGGIIVEDNFLSGNRQGIFYEISAPAAGDAFGMRIRNNRVVNCVHQGIYISASEHAIIENNTCYGNWGDIVLHGMPRTGLGKTWQLKDNLVRNNILFGGGMMGHLVVYTGEGAGSNTIDGNFYVTDARRPVKIGISTDQRYLPKPGDRKTLLKDTGFEEHALTGDPRCLDPEKGDFRLQPDSPAVGKGWRGE